MHKNLGLYMFVTILSFTGKCITFVLQLVTVVRKKISRKALLRNVCVKPGKKMGIKQR